jgi:two-component system chemotaxis response regulator CheB
MTDYRLIVVGASQGGLSALKTILGSLPLKFALPLVVVQHRSSDSNETLHELLSEVCPLPVFEVEDKDEILAGRVYLAPPGYHLLVEDSHFALSTDTPVCYARPSIDVLFQSAAEAYNECVVGVILTGANQDGAEGVVAVKEHGGLVLVQDPKTAEAREMPEAAIAATKADMVLPLEEIGPFLAGLEVLP